MHTSSAAAATMRASVPRSRRLQPEFAASSSAERLPRSTRVACGRMSFSTTPMPDPIMRPMPRLETMPWAVATSHRPAALPPTMMPKLPTSAPKKPERHGKAAHEKAHGEHLRRVVDRKAHAGDGKLPPRARASSPARRGLSTTGGQAHGPKEPPARDPLRSWWP